jgi:hypothetical protein
LSVSKTLEERGSRYGEFADHARIAQGLQDVMRAAPKWQYLDFDMKQSLTVIADKIARILNGDPFYVDNWHDLQGYAQLIENRLNMIQDAPQELYGSDDLELGYIYKAPESGILLGQPGSAKFSQPKYDGDGPPLPSTPPTHTPYG